MSKIITLPNDGVKHTDKPYTDPFTGERCIADLVRYPGSEYWENIRPLPQDEPSSPAASPRDFSGPPQLEDIKRGMTAEQRAAIQHQIWDVLTRFNKG